MDFRELVLMIGVSLRDGLLVLGVISCYVSLLRACCRLSCRFLCGLCSMGWF
jgi:hypothetical protein